MERQPLDESANLIRFSLPDLLPAGHSLVVHPNLLIVTLIRQEGTEAQIVQQCKLSVNGIAVLLPLVQLAPDYCPYHVLLASLFPNLGSADDFAHTLQRADGEDLSYVMRPLRRAIRSLVGCLRMFGLEVHSLRGNGYLLRPYGKKISTSHLISFKQP